MDSSITTLLLELNDAQLVDEVNSSLKRGVKASDIILELRKGIHKVLDAYDQRTISQVEVFQASKTYRQILDLLEQSTEIDDYHFIGRVVVGQAHHDLHDKGRLCLSSCAKADHGMTTSSVTKSS